MSFLILRLLTSHIPKSCVVKGVYLSTTTMAKRQQPKWSPPQVQDDVKLRLYNSLTRQKEVFVPQNGKKVTWYNCGPTVYDASHMGHARTYLTFDILRRVLANYFGYNIFYVMNITDIDDKIIKRARQNHLYEEYLEHKHPLDKVLDDCNQVLKHFGDVVQKTTDLDKRAMQERLFNKLTVAVDSVSDAYKTEDKEAIRKAQEHLLVEAKDLMSDWLDKQHGGNVTDNAIFAKLPRYWENKYHQDMEALNILPADCLTRVSEYMPEIVAFIEKVIERGFAYSSNGSVYFDVAKFDSNKDHNYAKLVPEAYGDQAALREGEGDLSVSEDRLKEKKSENDFALWKLSKPGEPSWESPWGLGRPGWHIECSVMASSILGESIDIHTGGYDLKFPHHDNELAQSEAYFDNDHWIRYFLHSGHLTIAGCKMSKSLKNFITIADVLEKYSARQLRLAFLMHSWKDTLDYSENTMELAKGYEKSVNELFLTVKHIMRTTPSHGVEAFQKWNEDEIALNDQLHQCMVEVHKALCDNIDTHSVMMSLKELVSNTNIYIENKRKDRPTHNRALLKNVATFITRMFDILGLIGKPEEVGFPTSGQSANMEELVMPYLDALATFRDNVRKEAIGMKATSILKECDSLRDNVLPELGVRLEDKEHEATVIKLVDKEELSRQKEEKKLTEEKKKAAKDRKKAEANAKQAALEAQKKVAPSEMFKAELDKYSKFDDKGMPTHDVNGQEMSKAQLKKLQKLYTAQEKRYNDYMASQKEQ